MYTKIQNQIKQANKIALFTHQNADGDAVGSVFAMKAVLESLGKEVFCFSDSEIYPENLDFLKPQKVFNNCIVKGADLAIALDCAEKERMGKFSPIFDACKKTINIDHHNGNGNFAQTNLINTKVGSCCEIVFDLLCHKQGSQQFCNLSTDICKFLMTGIITDTGRFKYSSVSAQTLNTASKLLSVGNFNINELTTPLFDEMSMTKFNVNRLAMQKAQFFADNQVALVFLSYADLKAIDADFSFAKDLSQFVLAIKSVKACAIVSEDEKHIFYVSFRSKGDLDISQCAKVFGGGGHKNASGCRLTGHPETVKEKVIKAMTDVV